MIRNSMRSTRLFELGDTSAGPSPSPSLPLVCGPARRTRSSSRRRSRRCRPTSTSSVRSNRLLDLVSWWTNSPSMEPKVTKLKAQFPKLIAALKDPNDGTLPTCMSPSSTAIWARAARMTQARAAAKKPCPMEPSVASATWPFPDAHLAHGVRFQTPAAEFLEVTTYLR